MYRALQGAHMYFMFCPAEECKQTSFPLEEGAKLQVIVRTILFRPAHSNLLQGEAPVPSCSKLQGTSSVEADVQDCRTCTRALYCNSPPDQVW